MADIMVKAEHIEKSFGSTEVLKDISFSLEKGKVLSIIGPSGSGKSTLLRIITQLETADGGSLTIDGDSLFKSQNGKAVYVPSKEMHSIMLKTGLVFQSFNLFPHFTVMRGWTPKSCAADFPTFPAWSTGWKRPAACGASTL